MKTRGAHEDRTVGDLFPLRWQAQAGDAKSWDKKAAAAYLDERMSWWETWPSAARDHGTFCVSCHTAMPYALARPALRSALAEHGPSPDESAFIDNISKRVKLWQEVEPFYSDAKNGAPKSVESRGTEAVLNALVLARYEAPAAIDALRNMWALQLKAGDSAFWGASLAGIAAGWAPESYRKDAEVQQNVAMLADYLQREQQNQSTLNRAVALWASGKLLQLLKPEQRAAIVAEIAG